MPPEDCLLHPLTCLSNVAGNGAGDAATSAWDSVCKSFADAAAELLKAFGQAFAALPTLNLESAGISSAYGISLSIAAVVAALLVFAGVARTALTHDGSGLAQAATGVAKAVLAWLVTAAVATAALEASDQITGLVVSRSFGSQQALAARLADIVNFGEVAGDPGQVALGGSLLLVFALIGIALVVVLWFELLLRNMAIAVLVATAPIAAAGQASESTKEWWGRTCSATAQLIVLKPVIALVFAVGFGMAGTSRGVESLLEGLLVLGLAAFSWPVIARFFTFGSVQATSSSGLATALGFLAGQASQSGPSRGRGTAGVSPDQWSMAAENRTMAGWGESAGAPGGGGLGGAGAPGPGAASGGGSGGGSGAAVMAGIGFGLAKAHQAGTALSGRMEQTAAHGGMPGAYPYSTVSPGQRPAPGGAAPSAPGATGGPSRPAETAPPPPDPPPGWDGYDPGASPTPDLPGWSGYDGSMPFAGGPPAGPEGGEPDGPRRAGPVTTDGVNR